MPLVAKVISQSAAVAKLQNSKAFCMQMISDHHQQSTHYEFEMPQSPWLNILISFGNSCIYSHDAYLIATFRIHMRYSATWHLTSHFFLSLNALSFFAKYLLQIQHFSGAFFICSLTTFLVKVKFHIQYRQIK